MSAPDFFEHTGKRGFYRPVLTCSFERAVDLVADALAYARSIGLTEILVNTTLLSGFPPPTTFQRYAMAVKWAQGSAGVLRVAMVARPELIDPEKIGMVMAQNRGVSTDVFTNEPDGVAWLDKRAVTKI